MPRCSTRELLCYAARSVTTSKSGDSGSTDRFLKQHTERGLKRGTFWGTGTRRQEDKDSWIHTFVPV